jgi:hypothetical protein
MATKKKTAAKAARAQVRISEELHKRLSKYTAGETTNNAVAEVAIDEYIRRTPIEDFLKRRGV